MSPSRKFCLSFISLSTFCRYTSHFSGKHLLNLRIVTPFAPCYTMAASSPIRQQRRCHFYDVKHPQH